MLKYINKYGHLIQFTPSPKNRPTLNFLNNFGNPLELINIENREDVDKIVKKIDDKNIIYFDILISHKEKREHYSILESEL